MNHDGKDLPVFLKEVGSTARKILRKNNEIRFHQCKRGTKPNTDTETVSKVGKKSNSLVAKKSICLAHREHHYEKKAMLCIKGNSSCDNDSTIDSLVCPLALKHNTAIDYEIEVNSDYLRKRYRSISSWEDKENGDTVRKDNANPLKDFLSKHINEARYSMDKMTAKRLSKFDESVYNESMANLDELHAICLQENDEVTFTTASKLLNETKLDEDTLPDEANHMPLVLKPSSRIVYKLPPKRWPLVIAEPILPLGIWSYISIYRYCDDKENDETEPLFTIEFHDNSFQNLSRNILYDHEMEDLSTFAEKKINNMSSLDDQFRYDEELREWYLVYTTDCPVIVKDTDDLSNKEIISIRVGITDCGCLTPVVVRITLESINQFANSTVLSSIDVPTNVIIAFLDLFRVVASTDVTFWTSSENAEVVWSKLIRHLEVKFEMSRLELHMKYSDEHSGADFLNWSGLYRNDDHEELMRALQLSNIVVNSFAQKTCHTIQLLKSIQCCDKIDQKIKLQSIEEMDLAVRILPPSAIRMCGRLALSDGLIPGVCSLPDDLIDEANNHLFTNSKPFHGAQVAVNFDRKAEHGSDLTVTTRVVLQAPVEAPVYKIFDPTTKTPPAIHSQPVDDPVLTDKAKAIAILNDNVDVLNEDRYPVPVTLIDPLSLDSRTRSIIETYPTDFNDETSKFYTKYGFRSKSAADSLIEKKSFPFHKFGMSEASLSANTPTTNKSPIIPSTEVCDYLLSEERNMSDFMHLVQNPLCNKDGGSPSTPMISIIHMKSYQVRSVEGIKMNVYLSQQEKKKKDKEEAKKQEVIKRKIEAADGILCEKLPLVYQFVKENHKKEIGTAPGFHWREIDDDSNGFVDSFDFRKPIFLDNGGKLSVGSLNTPSVCDIVNPNCGIHCVFDEEAVFETPLRTQFVPNILEYRLDLVQKRYQEHQVKDIILNAEQEVALEHISRVPVEIDEITNHNPPALADMNTDIDSRAHASPKTEVDVLSNGLKLVLATRHSNYDTLVHLLDEVGLNVDTCDDHGNSLLILAGQQGNRRLCKFLLRRGAYLNTQNHLGNTVLHYLYEYGHEDLAEYLIQKGADDSLLNGEGLTCFEGTSRIKLENL